MTSIIRYGRPNMANLPEDLGRSIIKTIISTPAPDTKKLQEKADEIESRIVTARREKFKGTI